MPSMLYRAAARAALGSAAHNTQAGHTSLASPPCECEQCEPTRAPSRGSAQLCRAGRRARPVGPSPGSKHSSTRHRLARHRPAPPSTAQPSWPGQGSVRPAGLRAAAAWPALCGGCLIFPFAFLTKNALSQRDNFFPKFMKQRPEIIVSAKNVFLTPCKKDGIQVSATMRMRPRSQPAFSRCKN